MRQVTNIAIAFIARNLNQLSSSRNKQEALLAGMSYTILK
jgi:hypothetical protein